MVVYGRDIRELDRYIAIDKYNCEIVKELV